MPGGVRELAGDVAIGWAIFGPICLLTLAGVTWGHVSLTPAEVRLGLLRAAAVAGVVMVPLFWAGFAYFATFNPQPPAARTFWSGGRAALLVLPLFFALAAVVVFESVVARARQRGASPRPLLVRILADCWRGAVFVLGGFLLVVLCTAAAGPLFR